MTTSTLEPAQVADFPTTDFPADVGPARPATLADERDYWRDEVARLEASAPLTAAERDSIRVRSMIYGFAAGVALAGLVLSLLALLVRAILHDSRIPEEGEI